MPTNSTTRWLLIGLLLFVWWNGKGGSFAPAKVTAAVYVYEGKQTSVPPPVGAALSKLNAAGIMATPIDDDVMTAGGKIPKQYEAAIPAAREAGLPALVVMAGEKVLRVVKGPTTEAAVLEAAK